MEINACGDRISRIENVQLNRIESRRRRRMNHTPELVCVCVLWILRWRSDFLMLEIGTEHSQIKTKYFPMEQATEKWSSSDSKNRAKVENHLSTTSNLNLNGFGTVSDRQKNAKNIGQEVIGFIWIEFISFRPLSLGIMPLYFFFLLFE